MKKVLIVMCGLALAGSAAMQAEDGTTSAPTQKVDFTLSSPVDRMSFAASDTSSSSSSSTETVGEERASLSEPFDPSQPPPRHRVYGRPRYQDRLHNADGSTKYAFMAGGGFTVPAGSTGHYQTLGYNFGVGGGVNFNKQVGLLVQFNWDNMGLPSSTLNGMADLYTSYGVDPTGLDGSTHLWSFTVDPIVYFAGSSTRGGAYVTGGVGYYRKITSFTLPSTGLYCDYYYGYCYDVSTNQEFDRYSSGAFGANGGIGFTFKPSNFSNMKLFAEAKYVWSNNKTDNTLLYQPNGYRTGYFPVTLGIRY